MADSCFRKVNAKQFGVSELSPMENCTAQIRIWQITVQKHDIDKFRARPACLQKIDILKYHLVDMNCFFSGEVDRFLRDPAIAYVIII